MVHFRVKQNVYYGKSVGRDNWSNNNWLDHEKWMLLPKYQIRFYVAFNIYVECSGFTDGSVVLTKGDITRDRHSKTLSLHEGNCPITGLAFRQAGKVTHLFVATLEKVQVRLCDYPAFVMKPEENYTELNIFLRWQCYTLSVKEYPRVDLDTHGCALRCSALTDPSQDSQFIVAGDDCVYLYQPDERGPCFAFDGHKLLTQWHRGYLLLLTHNNKSPSK